MKKPHSVHMLSEVRGTIPAGLPNSQKHKEIAVQDDSQWNEEDKTAQHHCVAPIGQCVRDIIPCTRCHQALRDIRAYGGVTSQKVRFQEKHQWS